MRPPMLRLALRSDALEERALRHPADPSAHGRGTTSADALIVYRSTCTAPHAADSFYFLTRITAPTVGLRPSTCGRIA
jgi:hypothetical protein